MATEIKSKHAVVSRPPYQLYMAFVDMRNFVQFLPEDKKKDVEADYDSIKAVVQGFSVGIRVEDRIPYSRIDFCDDGAPFRFSVSMHFDAAGSDPYKTDFYIEVSADLNFMMKMMLGSKLKDAMDKMVDGLAAMSEGRMPEGMDPSMFPEGFDPSGFGGRQA
ncbi:MAG: SRPBCC family protein [Bacteroidetes bacterium]|uniref:SRPBCC family protein n=1 Tax=Candidatus Cryptobacteroides faecipullorum TaxID=2840764 RepID=A0A9D9I862_9BACT|nr:SRPBCC family protein [Candidatus Cryptobacteroides faecipullorum]